MLGSQCLFRPAIWVALVAVTAFGCAARRAADTPLVDDPREVDQVSELTRTDVQAIQAALDDLAQSHQASAAPVPSASPRGRWSDVHFAVLYACDDSEMAVLRKSAYDWGWEYSLRTAEDLPVTLMICHRPPPQVYQASAEVGAFGGREARAASLIAAFERHMAAFGRKRQFPDER
jgi:hypothetical protein